MKILSLFHGENYIEKIKEYTESLSLSIDSFENCDAALLSANEIEYDLVLVDAVLPKLDGLEFTRRFRHENRNTPVILFVNTEDIVLQEKALKIGAFDIVNRPVSPILLQARVEHALHFKKSEMLLENEGLLLQDEVKNATKTLQESEFELLEVLAKSCEYKEHSGSMHSLRIAHYTRVVAKAAGLNENIQDVAFHASRIYDIGKVTLADEMLLKKEKLSSEELELMQTHARAGYDLLKYAQGGYLKAGAVISYSHHEKYDGTGYPIGLKGETIPMLGRIVAIADVFDALTSKRAYRNAWSVEDACDYLEKEKGKHFDPKFVTLFMDNLEEIKAIKNRYK